jgi:tetratricopeptide (TPR) repeat protein
LRLAGALARFWAFRGHLAEARTWLTRLLDAVPSTSRTSHRAKALSMAGYMAMCQRDHAVAEAFCQQAIMLARELNDLSEVAGVADNLSYVLIEQGRFAEAEPLLQEAIAVCRVIGARERLAHSLANLGVVMRARGDRAAALTLFVESLALARDIGNRHLVATILDTLIRDDLLQGNLGDAEAHLRETIAIFDGLGDRDGVANALEGFALLASTKDASRRAARMWGAAERLRDEVGAPIRLHDQAEHNRSVSSARAACGNDAFNEAWLEGREMALEEAVRYAMESRSMGGT